MIPEKVLIYDLFGDFAQFKKYFTNMSPLSFSIPPRTALGGILGAILGIDKAINPEVFSKDKCWMALRIMNPVKKTKMAVNNLKTSESMATFFDIFSHKPTNMEFLKNVRFRIYVSLSDQLLHDELKHTLEEHMTVYTISLGLAGCLANYEYIGEYPVCPQQSDNYISLNTVIPMNSVKSIDYSQPVNLQKATLAMDMSNNREVHEYSDILYEQNGNPIVLQVADTYFIVENPETDIIHEY